MSEIINTEDNSSQNKDELLADFFSLVGNIDIDEKKLKNFEKHR